ncbi:MULTISPECIES: phage protein NinX family protein [Yersinia]|uniref:phage protein NinX family protein n=1 Tax=Yersinia TaxID=629 RepID=UPI000BFC0B99|nr:MULTISPECIES: phage protein NinX family protein [Yersinia]ATM86728.1 protein ninX [Yersinia frederiksenii]MCB5318089.1 DUF2591 domain-containing protein [Yersinia massiliensis]
MKDYSAMSDFELNKAVANYLGKPIQPDSCQDMGNSGFADVIFQNGDSKDYCNSPADAWPIIVENKISLNWSETEKLWCAHVGGVMIEGCWCWDNNPIHHHDGSNPLRTAMIVFLMMVEGNADAE